MAGRRIARVMSETPPSYAPIIRLWILRILAHVGGVKALAADLPGSVHEVLNSVGIEVGRGQRNELKPPQLLELIKQLLEKAEQRLLAFPKTPILAKNLTWLAEVIGLNQVEQDILHLVALQDQNLELGKALDSLGSVNLATVQRVISILLSHPLAAVRRALEPNAALRRTGLLDIEVTHRFSFSGRMELLQGFADCFGIRHRDPFQLFSSQLKASPRPRLTQEDFPHLAQDLSILDGYLRDAFKSRRVGVNVLIYGPPGSGKTEMVRMLSQRVGAVLFEVASENSKGDALQGSHRFRAYRLSQSILAGRQKNLILFDEVEDVFREENEGFGFRRGNSSGMKGWVNRVLESNPIPAFWITNHLPAMDKAFVRRFDFALKVDIPPRSVRRRILDGCLTGLPVEGQHIDRLAEHDRLAPEVVERASKVARILHRSNPEAQVGDMLERVIGNTLKALGASSIPAKGGKSVLDYRQDLLNTDCDLEVLLEGLKTHRQGRLCLYGPPGTGKSAFGCFVAERLDRPLLTRRASDLLSKWVGETEQLLAAMFREAKSEEAVLLLDEADSFLRDRGSAERSWELTQVNEMLTQMEAYQGVFIASTNLMGSLDGAALRRFDARIRFGYLKQEQAWEMFKGLAFRLGFAANDEHRSKLGALTLLTPGDFAQVGRQATLRRIESASSLLERLAGECQAKPEGKQRAIGFGAMGA